MDVGSLIGYATNQIQPIYPPAAKSFRTTGVVKVEVTVNEAGDVAEVQKTSGPSMLQTAARDAVRKWKFKPFTRDGQPVKAPGFVSFNFNL
jgi:protein TonB